jgi:hypothetical protein
MPSVARIIAPDEPAIGGQGESNNGRNGARTPANDFPWEAIYPYLELNKTICRGILGPVVGTQGHGPYFEEAFDDSLVSCGITVQGITEEFSPSVIVLGRRDWNKAPFDALEEQFVPPRIYSQEMVIASMAIGRDIFELGDGLLVMEEFAPGHPALEYVWGYQRPESDDPWDVPAPDPEEQEEAIDVTARTAGYVGTGLCPPTGPLMGEQPTPTIGAEATRFPPWFRQLPPRVPIFAKKHSPGARAEHITPVRVLLTDFLSVIRQPVTHPATLPVTH